MLAVTGRPAAEHGGGRALADAQLLCRFRTTGSQSGLFKSFRADRRQVRQEHLGNMLPGNPQGVLARRLARQPQRAKRGAPPDIGEHRT